MPSLITPLLLLLSAASTLSTPLPVPHPTLTESRPYALHNISIFSALNPSHNASHLSFTFVDSNVHLQLITLCERTIPKTKGKASSSASSPTSASSTTPTTSTSSNATAAAPDPLADPSTWYACANSSVSFIYAGRGKAMQVQRSYVDESVGEAPWDVVTAFAVTEGVVAEEAKDGKDGKGKQEGVGKVSRTRWGVSVTINELKATVTGEIA